MYAIEYKTDSCGICETVERNLKASGIKFKVLDKSACRSKIYKVPYVEFYTDDDNLVEHRVGLISIYDIRHIMSVYDRKNSY